jgi:hypothetical protein
MVLIYNNSSINTINKILILLIITLIIFIFYFEINIINILSKQSLSPELKNFLNMYGNYIIHSIKICKRPVDRNIEKIMNVLTFFKLEESKHVFNIKYANHVYLVISISPPNDLNSITDIILEKNEVVDIYLQSELNKKMRAAGIDVKPEEIECIELATNIYNVVPNFTLNKLIKESIQKLKDKFYYYHCITNNCQVFAKKIGEVVKKQLKSKNINPNYRPKFYFQRNAYILLQPFEFAKNVATVLTDALRIIRFWNINTT